MVLTLNSRFSGHIDTAKIRPGIQQALDTHSGSTLTAGDDLSLRYEPASCDIFISPEVVVLLCTDRGDASQQASAREWAESYLRKGGRVLADAASPYSVACIDLRSGRILLATDRFGIFPMHFSWEGSRLFFSDSIANLSRTGELRLGSIFAYFYFHAIPAPDCIYSDVVRLEGGTQLTASARGHRIETYWSPVFDEENSTPVGQLKEEFLAILREAVAIEANCPSVGCFLSGGTDSSTVAGMLSELNGSAKTFSIGFDQQGYDEMEYARIASRHFHTAHHEYYVTPDDIATSLPQLAASFDQPFGNSSVLPTYYCGKVAREHGIERMLAGDGGDELFGGNVRYARQRIFQGYEYIPPAIRTAILEPFAKGPLTSRLPLVRKAASYVRQARVPMPDRLETYNLLNRLGLEAVFTAAFLDQVDTSAPGLQQRCVYQRCQARSLINRMLAYDWKYTLADNDLVKVCAASRMAHIGVGFPLLSHKLVDFSLRLQPNLKLKGLKLRFFFKDALRDFLPSAILTKQKHGFGLPFGPWLASHKALQNLAADSLASFSGRNIVRSEFTRDMLTDKLNAHPGYFGEMVWLLVSLENWLRTHAPEYRV